MKWKIFIIIAVFLALGCSRTDLLGDLGFLAICAGYTLLPFIDTKHVRARWATVTILLNGLLGVVCATVYLLLHGGWLVVGKQANHLIHTNLSFAGGIFLGVTFTLMIAGQLPGHKRDDQEVKPS